MLVSVSKNVAAQAASLLVSLTDRFFGVSVLFTVWGPDRFGAWATAASAAGLLALFELGFNIHFGNAMQRAWARGDRDAFQRVFSQALLVPPTVMGVIAIPVIFLIACGGLTRLFPLAGMDELDGKACFALLAAACLLGASRGAMAQTWRGRHQFALGSVIALAPSACVAVGIPVFVFSGAQPVLVAAFTLLSEAALGWGFSLWLLRRSYPDLYLALRRPTRAECSEIATSVRWLAPLQALPYAWGQLPVLLLAAFGATGSQLVSLIVVRTFTNLARTCVTMVSLGSGVEIVALHHAGQTRNVSRALTAMGEAVSMLAAAASVALLLFGQRVTLLWTGRADLFDVVSAGFLIAGTMAVCIMSPITSYAMLSQNARPLAIAQMVQLALAAATSLLLIPFYGPQGAACSFGAAEVLATGMLLPAILSPDSCGGLSLRRYRFCCCWSAIKTGVWCYGGGKLVVSAMPPHDTLSIFMSGAVWICAGPLPVLIYEMGDERRRFVLEMMINRLKRWRFFARHSAKPHDVPPPSSFSSPALF